MRAVYNRTKEMPYPGPGIMFIFAGCLYLVASGFACALPKEKANSYRADGSTSRDEYDEIDESDDSSVSQTLLE